MKKPTLIKTANLMEIIKFGKGPFFNRLKEWYNKDPITHHMGFAGLLKVEVLHGPTGVLLYDTGWFPNLITNAGLNGLGIPSQPTNMLTHFAVGSDNTAPATSNTTLGSQLGNRSNTTGPNDSNVASGPDFKYWRRRYVRDFPQGGIEGNVNEVGGFNASSGGIMWFRQVLPATIVLTSPNENVLRISYDLRIYLGRGDVDAAGYFDPDEYNINVTVDGSPVSTDIESRVLINNNNGHTTQWFASSFANFTQQAYESNTMPNLTTSPSSGVNHSSVTTFSYTTNNFYVDRTSTWNLAAANFSTGIGAASIMGAFSSAYRLSTFNPKIPKDNTRVVQITHRLSWGRRDPDDPT